MPKKRKYTKGYADELMIELYGKEYGSGIQ